MSARTLDHQGLADEPGWLVPDVAELRALAERFPVGSRIVHACGRGGIVALDQPEHVPGVFEGGPTAVCLSRGDLEPMVFAHWENDCGLTWGVWVRADKIRRSAPRAANRPGNKARIGGR
ncbi:hypothetical protein [Streptomyces murinus]